MSNTLNSLIDQAVDQCPVFRRMAYKALLRSPRVRSAFAATLADKMVDEPCCASINDPLRGESFDGDVALAIDPANLKAILDFIVSILPLILKLFTHV